MRFLIVLFLFTVIHMQGQENLNCASAIEIQTLDSLEINFSNEESLQSINDVSSICQGFPPLLFPYFNAWFKLNFVTLGDFIFTIKAGPYEDIDFIIFSAERNACTDLSAIRCMLSGANAQGGMLDSMCWGATGLSYEAEDVEESGGCFESSDNFVSALDVDTSLTYYLAISNFSGMDSVVQICFGGTAGLNRSTSVEKNDLAESTHVYYNANNLYVNSKLAKGFTIRILDTSGRVIKSIKEVRNNEPTSVDELPRGLYFVQLLDEGKPFFVDRVLIE